MAPLVLAGIEEKAHETAFFNEGVMDVPELRAVLFGV